MDAAQQKRGGWVWPLLAIVALVGSFVIFRGAGAIANARGNALPPPTINLPLVEVTEARPVSSMAVVEEGFLRPRAEIALVPEVSGKVVEVSPNLQPGGQFAAGEVLFRIDPRTFEADLTRAKADAEAARSELTRAEAEAARQNRLADIGAAAEAQRLAANAALAAARSRIGQAEASLTLAQKRMDDTSVSAPFDATVISKNVALGGYVQPGMNAATIFDRSAGEIVLSLLPEDAAAVRRAAAAEDTPLEATIRPSGGSASTASLTGTVKSFGQSVDARSRTVPVVVEVPSAFDSQDGGIFANDFVEVSLPAAAVGQLYAAPLGTVRAETFLWTLNEQDEMHRIEVQTVQTTREEVIFTSSEDLTGARLLITALTEETEGMRVEIYDADARNETLQ